MKVRIETIGIGNRYRQDLGDVSSLAASISDLGLLQPIVVTPGHELVAGQRRLEAVKSLGWSEVDVRIVESAADASSALKAERDENVERKAMTSREMVVLGQAIEEIERPKAAERKSQAQGEPQGVKSVRVRGTGQTDDGLPAETGRVRHEVGKALGVSGPTYQRLKTIVTTAEDESQPDKVREVATQALNDIDAGKRGVRSAAEAVVQARKTSTPPLELKTDRDHMLAAANLRKVIELSGELTGVASTAEGINIDLARSAEDQAQLQDALGRVDGAMKRIKAVTNQLKRGK